MQTNIWTRRVVLAVVWSLAALTWASISNYFMGLPDVGPLLVIGIVAWFLVRPIARAGSAARFSRQADTSGRAHLPAG